MSAARTRPSVATDDWILAQQMRAEIEAEAWRRLREERALLALEAPPTPEPVGRGISAAQAGSAVLKGLVRFVMAAFGAYLAYLAAVDSQLGEFEVWLAVGGAFLTILALSMFGFARGLVHTLAEAARWGLIFAALAGAAWLVFRAMA
jgi:hypothetical protein